ncbi:MATE family efflux transporter [Faecalibacillus intestinalis]
MERDLTQGKIGKSILLFSIPMILGNLLQQFYNIVDTYIVGKYIGSNALAAVGSSYTLMTFLTSIIIGLCMGSGILFSMYFGAKKYEKMKISLIPTIVSLGTRVLLAYLLVLSFGVEMIWWAIVIGWILADTIGIVYGIKIEKWFK